MCAVGPIVPEDFYQNFGNEIEGYDVSRLMGVWVRENSGLTGILEHLPLLQEMQEAHDSIGFHCFREKWKSEDFVEVIKSRLERCARECGLKLNPEIFG